MARCCTQCALAPVIRPHLSGVQSHEIQYCALPGYQDLVATAASAHPPIAGRIDRAENSDQLELRALEADKEKNLISASTRRLAAPAVKLQIASKDVFIRVVAALRALIASESCSSVATRLDQATANPSKAITLRPRSLTAPQGKGHW